MPSSLGALGEDKVCTYQRFDLDTLTPENDETRIRIGELEPLLPEVAGRTVLDLGCNGGLASLLAAKSGATHVTAIDVDKVLVPQLQAAADRLGLPITARRQNVREIGVDDRADVVFAFEVVHWLVHQGATLADVTEILRGLTGEILFIETPWDTTEPSIRVKETISQDDYSARDLIEALLGANFRVEIVHFSKYFTGDSKRVMIAARPTDRSS